MVMSAGTGGQGERQRCLNKDSPAKPLSLVSRHSFTSCRDGPGLCHVSVKGAATHGSRNQTRVPAVRSLKTTLPPTAPSEKWLCYLSLQHPQENGWEVLGTDPLQATGGERQGA